MEASSCRRKMMALSVAREHDGMKSTLNQQDHDLRRLLHVRTRLLILGMRTNKCRESIERALQDVAGVNEVQVNLYRARATVTHLPGCNKELLVEAVQHVGFSASVQAKGN